MSLRMLLKFNASFIYSLHLFQPRQFLTDCVLILPSNARLSYVYTHKKPRTYLGDCTFMLEEPDVLSSQNLPIRLYRIPGKKPTTRPVAAAR